MSKRLSAFFKFAVVSVGVSLSLAATSKPPIDPLANLPVRELYVSDRGGQPLRVGDTVSYELRGGDANAESRWQIDPRQGGLKQGVLFRTGHLITPLVAGTLHSPALVVVDENGSPVAKTDPVEIAVQSNLPPPEQGKPAEPPKAEAPLGPLGLPFPAWIQSLIGFAILFVVVVLLFFLIRAIKRRAARALRAMMPKKPYDVDSLERLDDLLRKGYLEKRTFKPLYFGVSETMKFYLGERFEFDARESTSSELVALLRERTGNPGLNESLVARVEKLFERMDPVKFADVIPNDEEARSLHREAKEIVLVSRKVVLAPDAAGGAKR